ncbi:MAG: DUF2851 family protein [Sphingobacteriales bacterium]|nr:DUF2851 family protein [Sphingobacteriales bacterium]
MNEQLLQYIWQFRYFNASELTTTAQEKIHILYPGILNTNQGPDFSNARIKIGNTTWAGSIELHLTSSGWKNHNHSNDKNYNNVILHVVWQDDVDLQLPFPTLELQSKVAATLLRRYNDLMHAKSFIACQKNISHIEPIIWHSWKERLLAERFHEKAERIFEHQYKNNNHWEESFWWLLARNFGLKVNSDAFEKIAQSISINILAKHKNQIHQTEALLFGQAGLLENHFNETYPKMLQKEYQFLKAKYQLQPTQIPLHFLRMRPSNFPTLRLAQLAMLIHNSTGLFGQIRESTSLKTVKELLNVTANDYWHYHFVFEELAAFKEKNLGEEMINNILINTVVPVLFAYGQYHKEQQYKIKAFQWIEEITAENNSITKGFLAINIENKNALDSQALIQLKNNYCNQNRCLECAIGNKIINTP